MRRAAAPLLVFILLAAAWLPAAEAPLPDGLYAEFTTPRGVFVAELFFEKTPLTCASFVGRAEGTLAAREGRPFFTGLRWYRVVPGFVIQSGDPTAPRPGEPPRSEAEEAAAHGQPFPDEFVPGLRHDAVGVLSMANGGPDTNSCEFFVTLAPVNRLNYLHAVFGRVVRGLEVLPQIRPEDACAIKILRRGRAAQAFKADAATVAALAAREKKYADFAPAKPEPGPAAHFADPARVLPADPPRARNFNFKLANFERTTGVRIVARLFAKSPPAAEDAQPGAWMRALAAKLGVGARGALAAYFADEDDWRVWIGDESTPAFVGRAGTAEEFTRSGAMHAAKEAFLKAALAAGDADFAQQTAAVPVDRPPPPPGQRVKLQADAILDGLIERLEPKR
jgi:cyclophilin family peptidyl-prolyl cis-trans isomerase